MHACRIACSNLPLSTQDCHALLSPVPPGGVGFTYIYNVLLSPVPPGGVGFTYIYNVLLSPVPPGVGVAREALRQRVLEPVFQHGWGEERGRGRVSGERRGG